jgi:hypothetical protein
MGHGACTFNVAFSRTAPRKVTLFTCTKTVLLVDRPCYRFAMTIIERAFEIARSGKARSITDIRTQLTREGFDHVQSHLSSAALQKQLKGLIKPRC